MMGASLKDTYRDKAGRRRRITPLQEKIVLYRMEHHDMPKSEVARNLKVSYTTVIKTETNPVCLAFAQEIKDMVNKAKVMGLQERQERLTEIARASITDFVSPDGSITVTADQPYHRAVAEFAITEGKLGEQRRIKLHSPLEAITILDKQDKIYSDTQVNINNAVIIKEVVMVRPEEKERHD